MSMVRLIGADHCSNGGGTLASLGDREYAVFLVGEEPKVYVLDNVCPHAGGNLVGGPVTETTISCPWHFWEFELSTGKCINSRKSQVRNYPAEIRGDEVWFDPKGGGFVPGQPL